MLEKMISYNTCKDEIDTRDVIIFFYFSIQDIRKNEGIKYAKKKYY